MGARLSPMELSPATLEMDANDSTGWANKTFSNLTTLIPLKWIAAYGIVRIQTPIDVCCNLQSS